MGVIRSAPLVFRFSMNRTQPLTRWAFNAALVFLIVAALGSVGLTFRLFKPVPVPPFPREPGQFLSGPALDAEELRARSTLQSNPDDIQAMVDLAVVLYQRGPERYLNTEAVLDRPWEMGALQLLERARHLGTLDERVFFYLGSMYESKGLPMDAADNYERHLRRHPEDLETRLRLGNLYYRLEDLDKSAAAYRRVLASRPGDPLVSFNLALVLRDKKQWSEGLSALAPFTEGGRSFPSGGWKLLGDLRRGAQAPVEALECYRKELEISGDSLDLALAMAAAHEDLKDADLAVRCWERVLQFDPDHREARAKLRRLKRPVPARRR